MLEALRLFKSLFSEPLIVESDSLNAISWVLNSAKGYWKFYFITKKSNFCLLLWKSLGIFFCSGNEADLLAMLGASE